MELGSKHTRTRKVKTSQVKGTSTTQTGITFRRPNHTLRGPSMNSAIGNPQCLTRTTVVITHGMKNPEPGFLRKVHKVKQFPVWTYVDLGICTGYSILS